MAARFEWDALVSAEQARGAFTSWAAAWEHGLRERNFAIVLNGTGEVIGDCEIELRPDGMVNVMYVVFAPWRRHGYATRAARLLIAHAASAFPGAPLAFRIHPDNHASLGVARAVGATPRKYETSRNGRQLQLWVRTPEPNAENSSPAGRHG